MGVHFVCSSTSTYMTTNKTEVAMAGLHVLAPASDAAA
jgi:hypothetical protein